MIPEEGKENRRNEVNGNAKGGGGMNKGEGAGDQVGQQEEAQSNNLSAL